MSSLSASERVQKCLREASTAFKKEEYTLSIRWASKGLQIDATHLKLLNLRASALANGGHLDLSLKDLQLLIKHYPHNARAYLKASDVFKTMGKPQLSIKTIQLALSKIQPSDEKYHDLLIKRAELTGNVYQENLLPTRDLKRAKTESDSKSVDHRENFGKHHLPVEVILNILGYLSLDCIARLGSLSRWWKEAVRESVSLWTHLNLSSYHRKVSNATLVYLIAKSKGALMTLNLARCGQLTSLKPLITHRCRKVVSIDISSTKLAGPTLIEALKCMGNNLSVLNLQSTRADDPTIRRILDACRKLSSLNVSECPLLTDAAFEICEKFHQASIPLSLTHVNLASTSLSDKSVGLLCKAAPELLVVNLTHCKKVSNQALVHLSEATHLQELYMEGVELSNHSALPFNDAFLSMVSKTKNLQRLEIPKLPYLSDLCMQHLATFCPQLGHLNIKGSANITDLGITLISSCSLKSLNVSMCQRITDLSLMHLLNTVEIQSLDISSLGQVTDNIFDAITNKAEHLTILKIANNANISSLGVSKLLNKTGAELEELNLDNCARVSRETIVRIKQAYPKMTVSAYFS